MKIYMKRCGMLLISFLFAVSMLGLASIHASVEEEIGRSNIGEWNGGTFYEYMTKEFLYEDDKQDTITYRIRYRLKHWGSWYTYQVTPINLFINDQYITTFSSGRNVHVANEDRINGVYDVTMKKGVTNKMELRDTGVSITVINVAGNVYAPLPTYLVTFTDGFGHTLKEEKVTKYASAKPPHTPSKDGYEYKGWDASYTNITSNKTIHATWKQLAYTLRISPNGGEWMGRYEDSVFRQNAGIKRDLPNPKRERYIFDGWSVVGLGFLDGFVKEIKDATMFDIKYSVSTIANGWQPQVRNEVYNRMETIEAIRIELGNSLDSFFSIRYRAYCQDVGWQPWVRDGNVAGNVKSKKRMEAIEVQLDGVFATYYDIEYRVNVETKGWMPWVRNGQTAGTVNEATAIRCIQLRLHRKKLSTPNNHTVYGLSGDATLVANWLPMPYIDVAYDRWFLIQEDIQKEDIMRVVKAYDEYHKDISDTIVMDGFESVLAKQEGDYTIHLKATSALGNTCEADIVVHVVDKLTKETIRGIEQAQIEYIDAQSKWQRNKQELKQKITQQEVIASFELKR